jgi:hypothetical protein
MQKNILNFFHFLLKLELKSNDAKWIVNLPDVREIRTNIFFSTFGLTHF